MVSPAVAQVDSTEVMLWEHSSGWLSPSFQESELVRSSSGPQGLLLLALAVLSLAQSSEEEDPSLDSLGLAVMAAVAVHPAVVDGARP